MDPAAYLLRIGYRGPLEPTEATLAAVHRAHLTAVPFENLDIHLGNPIVLALPALYAKVVDRRRGGFCYELNGLFAWLLRELGFEVSLLSARVFEQGQEGPEFDHLALAVRLEGIGAGGSVVPLSGAEAADGARPGEGAACWLADVGFGDSFLEPLPLRTGAEFVQQSGTFRIQAAPHGYVLERSRPPTEPWAPQYAFSMTPRVLGDFEGTCVFHQTSPLSSFPRRTLCSRATPQGRMTLANDRWIVTNAGQRDERSVDSTAKYRELLRMHFGVELPPDADVERLRVPRVRTSSGQPGPPSAPARPSSTG